MKKIIYILIGIIVGMFGVGQVFASTPVLNTFSGGTGLQGIGAGAIPFGSVANQRMATSSSLFWNNTNLQLGAGTSSPKATVHIATRLQTGTGTISDDGNGNITGSGTLFITELRVGDTITNGAGSYSTVITITDNTHMFVQDSNSYTNTAWSYIKPGLEVDNYDGGRNASFDGYGGVILGASNPTGTQSSLQINNGVAFNGMMFAQPGGNYIFTRNTTAGTNNKNWFTNTDGTHFSMGTADDAYSLSSNFLQVTRSGTTVSNVLFPNGNVGISTSSPWSTLSVAGTAVVTGTTTFDGGLIKAATSSVVSARETFGIPEPISSNGWLAQRIDTQVAATYLHPLVLGCAGDGFSYLLCGNNNAMLTALKGVLNFAGYEGGWANKIAGGAAVVSGDFATWISGVYSTLPSGGSLTFSLDTSADTPVFSDTIKIYYIKEATAGVFKVQTSLDDSSWSDLAAPCNSINAVNATQIGAVANCMTTLQTQYMRLVGVSGGTTKIVGDAIFASTSPSTRQGFVMIGQGIFSKDSGVSYENLTSAPSAVTAPIIAAIKPDLLVNFHAGSSSPSGIENFYNEFNNAYASTSWTFVGHPPTTPPTTWTYDDDIKRKEAIKLGIPYIDIASQWGTQDQATSSGMLGPDLVHPTAGGFDWIASKVISNTPILQFGHGQMSAATQFREVDSTIGGGIYQYNPSYTTTYHINGPGPRAISTGDPGSGGGYELLDYNANPTWDGWFLQVRNGLSFVSGCFANAFIQNCKFGYMDTPQNVATMNINSYGGTNVPLWVQQPTGATGDLADFTVQSYPAGSIGGIVAKIAVDGSITSQGATSTFSGSVRIGTTTNNSALEISGSSHIEEQSLATSTSMTIDFSAKAVSNILTMNVGSANIAVTFTNANKVPGKTLVINISAPATGSIGSTTFSGGSGSGTLLWDGGISPGNSVVNGSMDVFCFTSTNGTSTPIIKADLCGSF